MNLDCWTRRYFIAVMHPATQWTNKGTSWGSERWWLQTHHKVLGLCWDFKHFLTSSAFSNIVIAFSLFLISSALTWTHTWRKQRFKINPRQQYCWQNRTGKTYTTRQQTLHTDSKAGFSSTVVTLGRILLSVIQFKTRLLNPQYGRAPEEIRPSISGPA